MESWWLKMKSLILHVEDKEKKWKILKPNRIIHESLFSISVYRLSVFVFWWKLREQLDSKISPKSSISFSSLLLRQVASVAARQPHVDSSEKKESTTTGVEVFDARSRRHDVDDLSCDRHLSNWPPAAPTKASHHDASDSRHSILLSLRYMGDFKRFHARTQLPPLLTRQKRTYTYQKER